jgi:hypothetical protein
MKCPTHFFLLAMVFSLPSITNGQIYEVHTDTIQYFEHPLEMKFLEALDANQITYTKLGKGDVQYTSDLNNRKLVLIPKAGEESFSFDITEVFNTEGYMCFDLSVDEELFSNQ